MNDTNRVLTALRNELVTAELVRRPVDAGALPPLHVEPKGGPPAPGERDAPETDGDLVVTLRHSSEVPGSIADAFRRQFIVDLIFRSEGTGGLRAGRALFEAIRRHVVDANAYRMGQTLDLGGSAQTAMLSAAVFAGLSPLDDGANGPRTDMAKLAIEVLSA